MLHSVMTDTDDDDDSEPEPVQNEPFSRDIVWRVFDENYFPKRTGSASAVAGERAIATGNLSYSIPAHQSLTRSAVISGRVRYENVSVSRAILESVSSSRTYETHGNRYLRGFLLWTVVWVVCFVAIWPALGLMAIFAFIVLIAVLAISPPFVARTVVDFAWWAGRGFAYEARATWMIAGALWLLDILPLVFLQVQVS